MTIDPNAVPAGAALPDPRAAASRGGLHAVDPRGPRVVPPARRDLFAAYLDHMRKRAGVDAAPHRSAHDEFCRRLRIPDHIGDTLWTRWVRHYLRFGPDWS